jgi:hypothetical protein
MKVGNKVEVILSKDWVMVLDIVDKPDKSGVKYLCRTRLADRKVNKTIGGVT